MNGPKIIVDKSTVPVGTASQVAKVLSENTRHEFEVVSNPEFLKEGAALDDFLKPDRVVIGVSSAKAAKVMKELYAPFVRTNKPILEMDVASAELTKYAANAMLATRVSFMNEIANLCERVGADINMVRIGMGTDSRIGMSFLFPGIGYGGSCFPKDVQALIRTGLENSVELKVATAVEQVNAKQKHALVAKILKHYGCNDFKGQDLSGKTFAIWGVAFKPQTDDVREAPALVVCSELIKHGARIQIFDPEAMLTFKQALGEHKSVSYSSDNYKALEGADALVICTEWNEFRNPNFRRVHSLLKAPVVFDGRNIFDIDEMRDLAFVYYSVGRSVVGLN